MKHLIVIAFVAVIIYPTSIRAANDGKDLILTLAEKNALEEVSAKRYLSNFKHDILMATKISTFKRII